MPSSVRRRSAGCPSRLTLDELEAGDLAGLPEEARLRDHLRECAQCRQEVAARAADPSLAPDPDAVRALLQAKVASPAGAAVAARRWRSRRVAAFAAATAAAGAAAAGLLVVWRGGTGHDELPISSERAKGTLALTVHIKGDTGAIARVNGDGELRAGQEMRFSLVASQAGHAVVLGLDAAPTVTTYVPAGGAPGPVPVQTGPIALAGSVVADATPGFERVVAIVCPASTPVDTLRRQAEIALAAAGNRPEAISSLGTGCLESSVLLRKVPAP